MKSTTVKELIEKLQKLPEDWEMLAVDSITKVVRPEIELVAREPHKSEAIGSLIE